MAQHNDYNEQKHVTLVRPEWAPAEGGAGFTTHVMPGVAGGHDGQTRLTDPAGRHQTTPDEQDKQKDTNPMADDASAAPTPTRRRRKLNIDEYVAGVRAADRSILARTITLIESNARQHLDMAQEVLRQLLPDTGNSIRVGITGVPGVGKSTFIEAFGMMLCERGHNVAVLAVDPSSSVTGGSILGDKTRMELLSRHPNAFIRPSPSSGALGGVTRKSRETMLACEAAGFDVILVETVGVGQSEISVRSMVDFFLLLMLAGGGDELQGIKKGVVEIADALLINKADGDNKLRAQTARAEYARALHFLGDATKGWKTRVNTCSATTGEGIGDIWDVIEKFRQQTGESGVFAARRRTQMLNWMHAMIEDQLRAYFFQHPTVAEALPRVEQAVREGSMPPTMGAQTLLREFGAE